jgi:hypothetical protein
MDLAACEQDPTQLDLDGIENALEELRLRANKYRESYAEPGTASSEDARGWLLSMADLVDGIADDVDLFMEEWLFSYIGDSLVKARELSYLRDTLRALAESEDPHTADSSLA